MGKRLNRDFPWVQRYWQMATEAHEKHAQHPLRKSPDPGIGTYVTHTVKVHHSECTR